MNNYIVFNATPGASGVQIFNYYVDAVDPGSNLSPQTATFKIPGATGFVNIVATTTVTNAQPNIKTETNLPYLIGYLGGSSNNAITITLPSWASSTNDFYKDCKIKFIGGTGASSSIYTITAYVGGTTKTATLSDSSGNPAKVDRKSTRLNSSHSQQSRMPSSA